MKPLIGNPVLFISLLPMANPDGGDAPQTVNHCTAFNDRYMIFFYILYLKNEIIVIIPTPSNSNLIGES